MSSGSRYAPKALRWSASTRFEHAATMRFTWWYFPWTNVILRCVGVTNSAAFAATGFGSSSNTTPAVSFSQRSGAAGCFRVTS